MTAKCAMTMEPSPEFKSAFRNNLEQAQVPQNIDEDFGGQHRWNPRTQEWEPIEGEL